MIDKIPNFIEIGKKLIVDAKTIAEVEMINFVLGNFEKQGFMDATLQPWAERKTTDAGRAILTKSAALRDSIIVTQSNTKRVVVGSSSAYAKIHNEGGIINIPVTAKMRKFFWFKYKTTGDSKFKGMALTKKTSLVINMPKRQFMGNSIAFNNLIEAKFQKMIIQRFKTA